MKWHAMLDDPVCSHGDGMTRSTEAKSGRRRALGWLLVAAVLAGGGFAIKHTRHHVWPKRFAEVEPGRLYRAGYCEPGPLTDVIREYKIRTILTLLSNEPDSQDQQKEEAVAAKEGVRVVRIPMPGDGRGEFAQLDAAADVIADASKQPMLVHCYAGVNRTGAAYVAYRVRHCGWTIDRALAEAVANGYSQRDTPELAAHLRQYAAYLASRHAATQSIASSPSDS